ncbi:MAG TPA: hypothetical protein VE442_06355 [Jatrophihabitans sp.]|jgi:hypothetical protein|nr:hypothetical protein [Jatrophihabitans sp.]
MVKNTIVGLVGAFVIFYIVTSPDQAAKIVESIWNLLVDVAHGFGNFLSKLAS